MSITGAEVISMSIQRINGSGKLDLPEKLGDAHESPRKTIPGGGAGDRVVLSAEALQVAALADKARALPDVRQERVEAVRLQIAQGTQPIDPTRVALALMEFEDGLR